MDGGIDADDGVADVEAGGGVGTVGNGLFVLLSIPSPSVDPTRLELELPAPLSPPKLGLRSNELAFAFWY